MRFSDTYIMKLKKTRSHVRYISLKNFIANLLNLKPIKMDEKINTCIYKLLKPLSKLKSTEYYTKHVLRTAIQWRDLKTLGLEEANLKEKAHEISSEIAKFLQKLTKLLPHVFETPMHLWDQQLQEFHHRNPLKNGSISENVMKEAERVLFQPLH